MKKTAQVIHATTQKFTEVEDISEDVVILNGGNACSIIEVTATNFALLSNEEQNAKIYAYASLLNSLSFPIQVIIRSQKLDISSYLKLLENQAKTTTNQMLSEQIKLYRDFVQELVKVNTVLDKKFYICLSYSYMEKGTGAATNLGNKNVSKDSNFVAQAKTGLRSKADSLHSQLSRLNLQARTLEKEELTKLYYEIYNDIAIESNQIDENLKTAVVKREGK
jgi:hypothetical protein